MTNEEVNQLTTGDEVYWTDPDEGACSRYYTIQTIIVLTDFVIIRAKDGSEIECLKEELT